MRLGGAPSGGDPLTMGAGSDYAELCDLGPSRWNSRGYHPPHSSVHHHPSSSSSASVSHIRSNSFEAEDIIGPYGSARIGNSTSSLRGRSGLYYSPPGTSYTIVERPHSPHYYYNSSAAGGTLPPTALSSSSTGAAMAATSQSKMGSNSMASNRGGGGGTYLGSSSTVLSSGAGTISTSSHHRHNGKKRPISPEQVLRLFGTTASQSVPTGYHYSNGTRERGRRSPASSPPSTTHQTYRDRDRERDRSVPNIHELTTRTVTMSRDQHSDGSHGFGICVKGGKDSGIGVYISRVEEGSVAEKAGLRPGDTILEVNGTPFTAISHDEALKRCVQILKSSRQISMTVRSPTTQSAAAAAAAAAASSMGASGSVPLHGFGLPPRDGYPPPFRQTCSWMDRNGRPASPPMEYGGRRHERRDRVRRVELLIEPGQSLGLMIRGGVEYGLGIFITGVDKDSVADRSGLMIGDQILEVNGQSFLEVTHDEAVGQLKYHKRMSLLVRDVGKVPHSCRSIELEPWDAYSPTGTSRRKCPISAMVEEKARSLLPRHQFASLSYYITEYGARGMTIDAFVVVLLEMLDTPEKHTLVTEIRELVFPEDRTRYDELVYRRDRDGYRDHRRKMDHGGVGHPHDMAVTDVDLEIIAATGRSPSDDSALGMASTDIRNRPKAPLPYRPLSAGPVLHHHGYNHGVLQQSHGPPSSRTASHSDLPRRLAAHTRQTGSQELVCSQDAQDYNCDGALLRPRRGSETQICRAGYELQDAGGYFDGIRSHLGGLTQRVKSWYWGRPLELATKLSRSFDMKEESGALLNDKCVRRHQSMQRLSLDHNGLPAGEMIGGPTDHNACVVADQRGNLHITVKKTKSILGIAIEGGANTKHPLPRIINIHEHGAAYDAGGLEVGQLILEVNGQKVDGMHHQDVARLIAECFASRDKPDISFLVVEAKKSNMEPKPTALIFLEA